MLSNQQPNRQESQQYYKKRPLLVQWIAKQSMRLKLYRQTFALTVALMDQYYCSFKFINDSCFHTLLCLLIIASKVYEFRILNTKKMALNNKINPCLLINVQNRVLKQLNFSIMKAVYVDKVNERMSKWEDVKTIILNGKQMEGFSYYQQNEDIYLLYQQYFYLCHQVLLESSSITDPQIQIIQKYLLIQYIKNKQPHFLISFQKVTLLQINKQVIQISTRSQDIVIAEEDKQNDLQKTVQFSKKICLWCLDFKQRKQLYLKQFYGRKQFYQNYEYFLCQQIIF